MTGDGGAGPSGEDPEALVEPTGQVVGTQDPDAGGGQLERQGNTVQAPADLDHGVGVGRAQAETRLSSPSPLAEQGHRIRSLEIVERAGGGKRQRRHLPGHLTGQPEELPAGHQHGQIGAGGQKRLDEAGRRLNEVLGVVEHEQHPFALEVFSEPVQGGIRGASQSGGRHSQGAGHGLRQQGRVMERPHVHPPDAVGEGVEHTRDGFQGQAALAASAEAGEGDEAGGLEQVPDVHQFPGPADKGGEGGRKVVPAAAGRAQGGEGGGQVRARDLEHPLGPRQVGQEMLAQVDERDVGGEMVLEKVCCGLRAQHLAPEAEGEKAGGPVECGAEVVVPPNLGRSDVDGHAHPHGNGRSPCLGQECALGGESGDRGVRSGGESGAETVAGVGEDPAPAVFHGRPQQLVMAGQVPRHGLLVAFPASRARFDVGEQEDDGVLHPTGPRAGFSLQARGHRSPFPGLLHTAYDTRAPRNPPPAPVARAGCTA